MSNLLFNYQTLETPNSFRLLQMERVPGNTGGPYEYFVVETSFDRAPRYETMSYVWSTSDRSEMLELRDGKLLFITEVLKKALDFVANQCTFSEQQCPFHGRRCETGYLWVDQICIDQDDRLERSQQVKIMGRIYTDSSRTLVWLGRLARIGPKVSPAKQIPSAEEMQVSKSESMRNLMRRLRHATRSGRSFMGKPQLEILQSPWFQRAWVFQEVVLPPIALFILATNTSLPSQALTLSLPELHAKVNRAMGTDVADPVVDTIRHMYRRCSEQRRQDFYPQPPIEQTLSYLSPQAKTSEELDQLYAFFGLNFNATINFTPSYDVTLEEAMIATATAIIEGTYSLDLFEVIPRAAENTKSKGKIPAWVPDFRERHLVVPLKRSNIDFRQRAKSSPELYPVIISTTHTYYR